VGQASTIAGHCEEASLDTAHAAEDLIMRHAETTAPANYPHVVELGIEPAKS